MAEATPRPWRRSGRTIRGPKRAASRKVRRDGVIAKVGSPGTWVDEADANAEFIVKAVNAHDELVAACKTALYRLLQLDAEDNIAEVGPCPACEAIRKAIALAEARSDV